MQKVLAILEQYVEFIALDKKQKEVKGTFKSIYSDRVCRIHLLHLAAQIYHYGPSARKVVFVAFTDP